PAPRRGARRRRRRRPGRGGRGRLAQAREALRHLGLPVVEGEDALVELARAGRLAGRLADGRERDEGRQRGAVERAPGERLLELLLRERVHAAPAEELAHVGRGAREVRVALRDELEHAQRAVGIAARDQELARAQPLAGALEELGLAVARAGLREQARRLAEAAGALVAGPRALAAAPPPPPL